MIVLAAMLAAQQTDRAIELRTPGDIVAAASVEDALNSLVRDAASCKSPGMGCACNLRPGLGRLSAAYHSAIRDHPGWKQAAVQYVVRVNGREITTAVMFPAVRRQLDLCHVP